eukprot:984554-Amphidinium_carterae.2
MEGRLVSQALSLVWRLTFLRSGCMWQPLPMASWEGALSRGRGRGPIGNLRQMADRLHWVPIDASWRQGEQCFTWNEADYKDTWDLAMQLCEEVSHSRLVWIPALRLRPSGNWNLIGKICVRSLRCVEALEDLEHIVHHCPAWAAESREVVLPVSALDAPPCVKLHGQLPAPKRQDVLTHEPALASRLGVHTVWTDGSGRESSNAHFRRCGVGYYTHTGESVFSALARAEAISLSS